jgi:hypothetical protein
MNTDLKIIIRIKRCIFVVIVLQLLFVSNVYSANVVPAPENDPHYTKVGFFDIHVCNWPNRPLFFLAVFSSYEYKKLAKVEMFTPDGKSIGKFDFTKYRTIEQKGKPLKRAFIKQFDIPKSSGDGWYYTIATLKNGKAYRGEDFVVMREMQRASNMVPKPGAEDWPMPKQLKWDAIPGAKHYRVFIRDLWEGGLIHSSKVLSKPFLDVPKKLLKPGGFYSWQIHARDVNENVILGDFNHGSLTNQMEFTLASE